MSATGAETLIVEIGWGRYTNERIIECFRKWVRVHRPKDVKPTGRRGHDPQEWRAKLTRLSALRLLHCYTINEILGATHHRARGKPTEYVPPLPECEPILKAKRFCTDPWLEPENWYDARRESLKDFHRLLPFLPPNEKPLSEPTWGSSH
jgi:hypothetical protein